MIDSISDLSCRRSLIERTLRERGETEWNDLPPLPVHESEMKDEHTRTLFGELVDVDPVLCHLNEG